MSSTERICTGILFQWQSTSVTRSLLVGTIILLFFWLPLFAQGTSPVYGPTPDQGKEKKGTIVSEESSKDESTETEKETLSEVEREQKEFESQPLFNNQQPSEAEESSQAMSARTPDYFSLILWTSVIIVVILGGVYLVKKYLPATRGLFSQPGIQVLSKLPLNRDGSIYLLQIGDRILRIGATEEKITYMGEVSNPDEVARLKSQCEQGSSPSKSFSKTIGSMFSSRSEQPVDHRGDFTESSDSSRSDLGQMNQEISGLQKIVHSWRKEINEK